MSNHSDMVQVTEKALLSAVDDAINHAVKTSRDDLHALGLRKSPTDYFADAAFRHLFLRLCGADPETCTGGDPETAWNILYVGRNVARRWDKEHGHPSADSEGMDGRRFLEIEKRERQALTHSAEKFVLRTIMRVLLDHARGSDLEIDQRLQSAVDARMATIDPGSDTDREFGEAVKDYMAVFTTPSEA